MEKEDNFHTVRGYEIIDKRQKVLTHSMEDYLEMIYRNSLQDGYTRINELSESLNVQAPSATKMVQKLYKIGLLHYKKYGIILLTEEGKALGRFLYKRHITIEDFLNLIGVKDNLLMNTELIEHSVSNHTLIKIEYLILFFQHHPDLLNSYHEFIKQQNKICF